jgi:DNA-binding transcriptional LysR family regulator
MNDSDATLNMILDNQAEIGFIGKPVSGNKLNIEPIWNDRLVLAIPKGHRWVNKTVVTIDEVSREPFVVREKGSATRSIMEEFLQKNTNKTLSQFNVVCELGSSEAVKEAVIAGLGISILSIHAVKRELENGLICERTVEDCIIERNFYLIYKKRFSLMKHHKLFLDFVKKSELDFSC